VTSTPPNFISYEDLHHHLTDYDIRRLDAYKNNLVDFHLILDLIPTIARFFFLDRLDVTLSYSQSAILLATGLQRKTVNDLERELSLGSAQILALFNKSIRKVVAFFRSLEESKVKTSLLADKRIEAPSATKNVPLNQSMASELNSGAREANLAMKEKQADLLSSLNLNKFAVTGTDTDWNDALVDQEGDVPAKVTIASKGMSRQTGKKRDRESSGKKSRKGTNKKPKSSS
jgi:N-acetyltransferase 10